MVAFVLGDRAPSRSDDLDSWRYYGVRLMNAHLACLHTVASALFTADVVTPWNIMQVVFDGGDLTEMNPLDDLWTASLAMARNPNSRPTAGILDWRYFRVAPILDTDAAKQSFDLFAALLARPNRDAVLLRAELLVRAKVSFVENDFSGALTNAWTAAEGMLGDLLRAYLDENEDRASGKDEDGNLLKFINGERRKWLEGAEMTVRHTMEFLSLLDVLPLGLYRDARRSSKTRNDWLHLQKQPTYDDAEIAIRLAGRLFELLEGVPLNVLGPSEPRERPDRAQSTAS